ncbi:MAG: nucleoside monophosphate kinase [Methanobrevibacter sp.]|jgi:dephospho-CoA kinase|nr:nucleoside monophosphate kinase [Methanobrevibacter sp.]
MKILGISGLPGSGKSLISEIAKEKGAIIVNMGDIIREESKKRKISTGETAIELRKEQGDYVVAKLTIEKIKDTTLKDRQHDSFFLIEGIRSPYEVELFKKNFDNFKIVSVYASPETRFNRLKDRKREDDSLDYKVFKERDDREIGFGINKVIENSDYLINNEDDLNSYKNQINNFFNGDIGRS